MLAGCRHVCLAWAAIGLLTLAASAAAGLAELARVGAFALIAFGALRLAMAADELDALPAWLDAWRTGAGRRWPARGPRPFWSRPAPYVLLPYTGFVLLAGRVLLRPPLGPDARLLVVGLTAVALVLTVVYLALLAVEGAQAVAATAAVPPPAAAPSAERPPTRGEPGPEVAMLDTTQFAREVLGAAPPGEAERP